MIAKTWFPRMRISDLSLSDLTIEQLEVHSAIASGPRGQVPAPLRIWLHSSEFAKRAQALGEFCRYGTSLPQSLSELAILVIGAYWQASYEWQVHAQAAREAGLSETIIRSLAQGQRPDDMSDEEAAVHDFASSLLHTRNVPSDVFSAAVDVLGEVALVELVGILGYYTLISMTIQAFAVPPINSIPDPFPTTSLLF